MCSPSQDSKPNSERKTDPSGEGDPVAETDPGGKTKPGGRGWARRVYRLVFIAAGTYVAVCVAVFFFQSNLIYFPTEDYRLTPDDVGLAYEDLSLATTDGETIAAWFVPHENAAATVLFCHGNAGNMSHRVSDIHILHELGYGVLIFDYRGYGRSTGNPSEDGLYADAEAAWRYLTETRGERPDRIVLFGRSLGGAVAIELARRHNPAALVVESTFTSLVDVGRHHYPLLPVSLIATHRFDSLSKIAGVACPKLFLHGTDDALIPIDFGRALYDAAQSPKRFLETPGGHNNSGFTYSSEYTRLMTDFVNGAVSNSAP